MPKTQTDNLQTHDLQIKGLQTSIDLVTGVVLAGGKSSRMSSDAEHINKSFCQLNGETLLQRVIDIAQPQVSTLIINSDQNKALYQGFKLAIVEDSMSGHLGPLAGILSAMEWAVLNTPDSRWIASFATDSPFIPGDTVQRLLCGAIQHNADIACVRSNNRSHPVIGLWSIRLMDDLRKQISEKQNRKVRHWANQHAFVEIEFDGGDVDPFFNINTKEDLAIAEKAMTSDE